MPEGDMVFEFMIRLLQFKSAIVPRSEPEIALIDFRCLGVVVMMLAPMMLTVVVLSFDDRSGVFRSCVFVVAVLENGECHWLVVLQ